MAYNDLFLNITNLFLILIFFNFASSNFQPPSHLEPLLSSHWPSVLFRSWSAWTIWWFKLAWCLNFLRFLWALIVYSWVLCLWAFWPILHLAWSCVLPLTKFGWRSSSWRNAPVWRRKSCQENCKYFPGTYSFGNPFRSWRRIPMNGYWLLFRACYLRFRSALPGRCCSWIAQSYCIDSCALFIYLIL